MESLRSIRKQRQEQNPVRMCVVLDEQVQVNRTNWNERTPVHAASEFYDVEGFKSGRITLHDVERREVGDVSGKSLLHLQCHFGMDTMSWSRLGARATGVDLSDAAIDLARSLNRELRLDVRFIHSNVYDLPDALDEQFDVVFTSYGVLCWLPDLDKWASVVENHLKPGGMFYIIDGHPSMNVFEQSDVGELRPVYPYFHKEFLWEGGEASYAGSEIIESPVYEWHHSLGEIVTALIDAGLRIEFLHEFAFSTYRAYRIMQKGDDGLWRFPEGNDSFPQLFSIRATK